MKFGYFCLSWTKTSVIICWNPFAPIVLPLGLMNKKSGFALSTKNEESVVSDLDKIF